MESRAKLLGHPIHQMLIVFPLGLLATAVFFDLLAIALTEGYWSELAYWMIAAGVVTGLVAAPFGTIDWFAVPSGTRAKRIGAVHGIGNVVVAAVRRQLVDARRRAGSPTDACAGAVLRRGRAGAFHRLAWR